MVIWGLDTRGGTVLRFYNTLNACSYQFSNDYHFLRSKRCQHSWRYGKTFFNTSMLLLDNYCTVSKPLILMSTMLQLYQVRIICGAGKTFTCFGYGIYAIDPSHLKAHGCLSRWNVFDKFTAHVQGGYLHWSQHLIAWLFIYYGKEYHLSFHIINKFWQFMPL